MPCGKTTLLRLIGGLLPGARTDITVTGDVEVMGGSPESARQRRQFGIVFQNPRLLPWLSNVDNVYFPLRIMRDTDRRSDSWDVDELLKLTGLYSRRNDFPTDTSPPALSGLPFEGFQCTIAPSSWRETVRGASLRRFLPFPVALVVRFWSIGGRQTGNPSWNKVTSIKSRI